MTKEIKLAAVAEHPVHTAPSEYHYPNCAVRDLRVKSFIKGAQWMATRDRWVSVETAKPTDNHRYLIIDDDGGVSIDFYNLDENRFFCEEADDMFVTHFQELPSPPQSKNNNMKSNMENKIESDTDVVYVADEKGKVLFIRTFDLKNGGEPERQKAIATYAAVNEQFGYGCLTSIQRFKIQIEK